MKRINTADKKCDKHWHMVVEYSCQCREEKIRKVLEMAERTLKSLEWVTIFEPSEEDDGAMECQWCYGLSYDGGHKKDCEREVTLSEIQKLRGGLG